MEIKYHKERKKEKKIPRIESIMKKNIEKNFFQINK